MLLWLSAKKKIRTWSIFISTTSSDPGSVPTNLACVTASAMFSIAMAALSPVGSVQSNSLAIKLLPENITLYYSHNYTCTRAKWSQHHSLIAPWHAGLPSVMDSRPHLFCNLHYIPVLIPVPNSTAWKLYGVMVWTIGLRLSCSIAQWVQPTNDCACATTVYHTTLCVSKKSSHL